MLYWTEPQQLSCDDLNRSALSEIWYYSRHVRALPVKRRPHQPRCEPEALGLMSRYIPPGYVPLGGTPPALAPYMPPAPPPIATPLRAARGTTLSEPTAARSHTSAVSELLFLGQMTVNRATASRRECFMRLRANRPDVGPRLHARYDLFSSDDWRRLYTDAHNGTVFLNLHRLAPAEQQPLESFRVASVLSMGGILVTQVCCTLKHTPLPASHADALSSLLGLADILRVSE